MKLTKQDFLNWLEKQPDTRRFYNGNCFDCMGHAFLSETVEEEKDVAEHHLRFIAGSFNEEGSKWFWRFFSVLKETAGHSVFVRDIKRLLKDNPGLDTPAK